jgi:hypothetical protein
MKRSFGAEAAPRSVSGEGKREPKLPRAPLVWPFTSSTMSSSGTPPIASGSGSAPNRPTAPAFSSARSVHANNSSSSAGASTASHANAGRPGPSGLSAADKGKAPTTGPRATAPAAPNGGRVVQNASNGAGGGAGAAAGAGGAVAGPGGVVRRSTPNTILINVCQVSSGLFCARSQCF